jgi:hypothetical protein
MMDVSIVVFEERRRQTKWEATGSNAHTHMLKY